MYPATTSIAAYVLVFFGAVKLHEFDVRPTGGFKIFG
jgi:hypothetical protein